MIKYNVRGLATYIIGRERTIEITVLNNLFNTVVSRSNFYGSFNSKNTT